ncbi:MAG: DUF1549 domain-containing protein, partial [Candidatus Saccharimonas sp.]|nr:DUF1549 domain-containing protein [Planctomycetaceae bacterium]
MRHCWIIAAFLTTVASSVFAQVPTEEGLKFFEMKIRPVLVQHCYSCHSVQARDAKKLQGGLFLDSAAGTLAGGENGPALVKGKSAESRMIKALKYDGMEMPPSGKLSDEIVADFVKWIDMGAPDPREGAAPVKPKREINIDEGRKWWSFLPLQTVMPPAVPEGSRIQTPIDNFVVAAQVQQKLKPHGPASKEKLVRRAYFDLIGLPPTPEQ